MDVHVRRIERELSDARSRLDDSSAEVGYMEHQSALQRQQLLALGRALSESTQAAADVMANIQLSAYRARERVAAERPMVVQFNGLADSVAKVVDLLAEEIDQQCERLNSNTANVQAQLVQQSMSVAVVDVSGQQHSDFMPQTSAISTHSTSDMFGVATFNRSFAGDATPSARRPSGLSRSGVNNLPYTAGGGDGSSAEAVRLLRSELISVRQRHAAELARTRDLHEAALGTLACTLKADLKVRVQQSSKSNYVPPALPHTRLPDTLSCHAHMCCSASLPPCLGSSYPLITCVSVCLCRRWRSDPRGRKPPLPRL